MSEVHLKRFGKLFALHLMQKRERGERERVGGTEREMGSQGLVTPQRCAVMAAAVIAFNCQHFYT